MAGKDEIFGLISNKTDLINSIIEELDKKLDRAQSSLLKSVVNEFVDKLDKDEDGNIKNTLANKQRLSLLDRVYKNYVDTVSVQLIRAVNDGINGLLDINEKYYAGFGETAGMGEIFSNTRDQIRDWLGITNRGVLVENGYMATLLKNQDIRANVQNSIFKSIISKKGYFEVKKDLSDYIQGNGDQTGALQKYYRNFVYDTFNQVDRTQSKIIADKLKLKYAIYEGGIIKTTRPFCRKRNGKVFTSDEIAEFDPPTAKQPNYNPFTDLGGFSCRHHLNYLPYSIAKVLRPDLPIEK